MKRVYFSPVVKVKRFECQYFMDKFSLPRTGEIDTPSVGQVNRFGLSFDGSEEDDGINNVNVWDD